MPAIFVPDPVQWPMLVRSPDGLIGRDMRRRGARLTALARHQAGVKTRRLRNSIHAETTADSRGIKTRVGSNNKIALLHHNGSRPHVIRPRKARALRFMQHGRIRYAQRVYHPGTKANRYLTDNLPKVVLT